MVHQDEPSRIIFTEVTNPALDQLFFITSISLVAIPSIDAF